MKLLTPKYFAENIFCVNLEKLYSEGKRIIITDIDNTIVPYAVPRPTKAAVSWFNKAKKLGFEICFLSNNHPERVNTFNENLGYYSICDANKPLPFNYIKCLEKYGFKKEQAVFFGDQLFTDVLGARLAGIDCVLVRPIKMNDEDPFIRFKRKMETGFLRRMSPKKLGVIGNPVAHSLSPDIHRVFYRDTGINAVYRRYMPTAETLPKYVEYFKNREFTGFNVTVPFKQEIIKYLDYVHPSAQKINSVNTVKIVDGKLYGYSTDGGGFCMQLENGGRGKRVKIIGAGGTTPSIVQSLCENGAKSVIIYNRTLEKAQKIADMFENVSALGLEDFSPCDCDILVNTSSKELLTGCPPVESLDGISADTLVFDANYKPAVTQFMKMAQEHGCTAKNGYAMLVNQGFLSHKIWFRGDVEK